MDPAPTEMSSETAALMAGEVAESIAARSTQSETTNKPNSEEKKPSSWSERRAEKKKAKEVVTPSTAFDRAEFVPDADTGLVVKGEKRGRTYTGESSREIFISNEVLRQHGTFLRRHLLDLKRLTNKEVLAGVDHLYERALLQLFDDGKGGIDANKVDEFTKTSRGLIITEMIWDRRTQLETFALSLDLSAAWNQHMQETPTEGANTFNLGKLAKEFRGASTWIRRHGGRFPDRMSALAGAIEGGILGASAGAFGTWLIQNHGEGVVNFLMGLTEVEVGAIIGGAGGAVIGGVLGRRFLSNNGDVDLIACGDNLEVIRRLPPQEQEYIRAVTGIDFADFAFTPRERRVIFGRNLPEIFNRRERVDFARDPADIRTKDIFTIKAAIRSRMHTRQEFYNAIGLVRPDTRTVPFNKLRPNFEYNPQTDTIWKRRLNELYRAELDRRGVIPGGPESLLIHLEVQQKVLNEYVEQYILEEGKGINRETGDIYDAGNISKRITEKITNLEADVTKTKESIDKRIGSLTSEETDSQKKRLETLEERFTEERAKQEEVTAIVSDAKIIAAKIGIDVISVNNVADLVELVTSSIGTLASNINREKQDATSEKALIDAGTMSDYEKVEAKKEVDKRVQSSISAIQSRIDSQSEALGQILEKQQESAIKQKEIFDYRATNIKPEVDQLRSDFDFLTDPSVGLTVDQLSTMTVGEVNSAINRVNRRRSTVGWGEDQNNNPTNLNRVVNAIIEAKTRRGRIETRGSSEWIARALSISESQLKDLSPDEINTRMNIRFDRSGGVVGWRSDQNEAMMHLVERAIQIGDIEDVYRLESTRSVLRDINIEAQRLEESKSSIENGHLKLSVELVKKELIDAQGELFARTMSVFGDADRRAKLLDLTNVEAGNAEYSTEQERRFNSGQNIRRPRAYYEWMQQLFKYKEGTNRGEVFDRAASLLRPIDLARVLMNNPRLNLNINPTTPDNELFYTVIRTIDLYYAGGLINETDIRSAVADIIISVQGRLDGMLG